MSRDVRSPRTERATGPATRLTARARRVSQMERRWPRRRARSATTDGDPHPGERARSGRMHACMTLCFNSSSAVRRRHGQVARRRRVIPSRHCLPPAAPGAGAWGGGSCRARDQFQVKSLVELVHLKSLRQSRKISLCDHTNTSRLSIYSFSTMSILIPMCVDSSCVDIYVIVLSYASQIIRRVTFFYLKFDHSFYSKSLYKHS
jgi:hypothetical protein